MYIDLKENGYDAVIERGCFERAEELLNLKRKVLIVTDDGVPQKYSKTLANKLTQQLLRFYRVKKAKALKIWKCFALLCLKKDFTEMTALLP